MATIQDAMYAKFKTLTGLNNVSISDMMFNYYSGLSGLAPASKFTLQDHQRAYWETQTGLTKRSLVDLEMAFYAIQVPAITTGSLADRQAAWLAAGGNPL